MRRLYRTQIDSLQSLTNKDLSRLETIANKKFNLAQRILLVDLGNTQVLLEVMNKTKTTVRVISQTEIKGVILRKSTIHSSTNKILAQIRERKIGIGKIFLCHKLDIFKSITEIGYVQRVGIFKNYSLYHDHNLICTITENFPLNSTNLVKK